MVGYIYSYIELRLKLINLICIHYIHAHDVCLNEPDNFDIVLCWLKDTR